MPLNTGTFQLQGLTPYVGPTAQPVVFNYQNGQTMAPHSGAEAFIQGNEAMGQGLGAGLSALAANLNPVALAQKKVALAQAQNEIMKTKMNQDMYKMFQGSFDNNTNGGSTQPAQATPTVGTTPDTSTQASTPSIAPTLTGLSGGASQPTQAQAPTTGLQSSNSGVSPTTNAGQYPYWLYGDTGSPRMGYYHPSFNGPEPSKQYEQWKTEQMNRSMPSVVQAATDPNGNPIGFWKTDDKGNRVLDKGMLPTEATNAINAFEQNKIVQGYPTVAQNYGTLQNLQTQLAKNGTLNSSEQNEAIKAFSQMANPGQGVTESNYQELKKNGTLSDQEQTLWARVFGGNGTVMSNDQFNQMIDAAKERYSSQSNAYNMERSAAQNSLTKVLGAKPSYINDVFPDRVSMYGTNLKSGAKSNNTASAPVVNQIYQKLAALKQAHPDWSNAQLQQAAQNG